MNNNMNSAMKTVGVSLAVGTAAPGMSNAVPGGGARRPVPGAPPLNRLRENAR